MDSFGCRRICVQSRPTVLQDYSLYIEQLVTSRWKISLARHHIVLTGISSAVASSENEINKMAVQLIILFLGD